ncbi:MAG: hypothetical protein PHW14_00185 [Candidatus Omnitrophica bacterium]|nr:hypothetical protein [Candidatus Omnitrophota bacterium]
MRAQKAVEVYIKSNNGGVMPFVLAIVALMVFSTASIITVIQRDTLLIQKTRIHEQARAMAEAGLNDAFGRIKANGYAAGAVNFTGSMDTGSYSVAFSTISGRTLVTSTGSAAGTNVQLSAEILDKTPTALNYFSGAGNNILIKIHTNVDGVIEGDIHANNDVNLYCQPHATLTIDGDVSATGIVQEGTKHYDADNKDENLFINGVDDDAATIYEAADRITFPELDLPKYKQDAIDSGDYYSSDHIFLFSTLSPGNGVVYVEGDAIIMGSCVLNGGLIADSITIIGTLDQNQDTSCDIIAAKNGDVIMLGALNVERAIVYASKDIYTLQGWGPSVKINGIMLARRDISMWNFRTEIDYHHIYMVPEHMTEESSGFEVVSYNN